MKQAKTVVEMARRSSASLAQRPRECVILTFLNDANVIAAQREAVGEATGVDGGRIVDVADDAAGEECDLQALFLSQAPRLCRGPVCRRPSDAGGPPIGPERQHERPGRPAARQPQAHDTHERLDHDPRVHLGLSAQAFGERNRNLRDPEPANGGSVGQLNLERIAGRIDSLQIDRLKDEAAKALEPSG
ncbi:MAG: hypothetical protein WD628_06995 [Thermomicrobiales bacterium]